MFGITRWQRACEMKVFDDAKSRTERGGFSRRLRNPLLQRGFMVGRSYPGVPDVDDRP